MAKVFGNRWEVVRDLTPGGQAWIYLVKDSTGEFRGDFVLKRLGNKNRLARFRQEVEAALRLDHPNIAKIVDSDLEGAVPFFVSRYCAGGSLADAQAYNLPRAKIFDLFGQICDAVLAAHDKKILHRDIKPDSIFLWEDRHGDAILGDFGLCLVDEDVRLTASTEVVGSRYYTAPELEDGGPEDATAAADVYSLGKLLYWLFSGGRQFMREKHRTDEWDLWKVTGDIYFGAREQAPRPGLDSRPKDEVAAP